MADINLEVEERSKGGRHTRNQLARRGQIPGVVYGREIGSMSLAVDAGEIKKIIKNFGTSKLIDLRIKGDDKNTHRVMIRDLQHDPLRNEITHVDFQKVSMADKIKTTAKIKLVGKPDLPGGVTVQHQLWTVDIECLPAAIPESITVDISSLKEGEAVHVADLDLPEGVKVTTDPGAVVALAAYTRPAEPETVSKEAEEAAENKEAVHQEEA
ncbi:large subunit ribosomal protein L25 [Desulfohalotomaculum tongense]|uniref:50S ribosomal protein L25 n=1 Tax=Desulforadius tongensis TaxID=1216062 RepID=UPI00195C172F|nr:50S ribosomal protein L25 [Desulforadius tongensis]MBM7855211.1 large subunit ribosomal protein L25 [Desulforadius tongensis]